MTCPKTTIKKRTCLLMSIALSAQNSVSAFVQPSFDGKTIRSYERKETTSPLRPSFTALFGQKMKFRGPSKVVEQTEFINIEEEDGSDAWKTMDVVEILEKGGVGILPTDAGYGFVTPVDSKNGLERILRIKGWHQCKQPLSLLCSDLASIDKYCFSIDRQKFKILKNNLPGPYSFILPAQTTLPKSMIMDSKGHKHSLKSNTVSVRIPDDPVLRYLQDELLGGMPLLISSLPVGIDGSEDDDDDGIAGLSECYVDTDKSWCNEVDFVVDAGSRPSDGTTVYDMTSREIVLVEEGIGEPELVF